MMTRAATPNASSCADETTPTRRVWQPAAPVRTVVSVERTDQERGALAAHPGQHDRGLLVPPQVEPRAQPLRDDVDAALLDREPADPALPERGLELLLLVGQLLEHLEAARERRGGGRVGGHVGDVLV